MVNIAEREIKQFIKKWKKNPYHWESETDVHAELYIRIKSSLCKRFPLKKSKYKNMVKKEYFDWVYCKPKTSVKVDKRHCYPDIVIYKGAAHNEHNDNEREEDPMLWVCEIKYSTEWSSDLTVDSIRKDVVKLQRLLEQKADGTGTDHACLLILVRWLKKYEKNKIPRKKNLNKIDKYLKSLKGKKIKLYYGEKVINNNGK